VLSTFWRKFLLPSSEARGVEKFSSYVGRQFLGPTRGGEGANAPSFQRNCE